MRILLAEDCQASADSYAYILRHCGDTVDVAYDGAMAYNLTKAKEYDVLITDNYMPSINGFELIEKLTGKIPYVFMISAYDEDRIDIPNGIVRYFQKPIDLKELRDELCSLREKIDGELPKHCTRCKKYCEIGA